MTTQPPCPQALFYDQQHFLDMFGRLLPQDYLYPLQYTGPGYEVLQAYGAVGERVSLGIARLDCGAHILTSFGSALATGEVQFSRPGVSAGAVTIKAGTIVTTSVGGRDFVTTEDLAFGSSDIGPLSVPVQAIAPGYEWNVLGLVTTAGNEQIPGQIDSIKKMIQDPAYTDTTFIVSQANDTTGGQPAMLDQLGADRDLPRHPGESDAAYKLRIRRLPDTVSPNAIVRTIHSILDPLNASFDFIETFLSSYQESWDVPSPNTGTPTYQATIPSAIDTNLFTYDDPRPAYPPFRNRWLDDNDFRGAFIVTVPDLGAISDCGMAYDDNANDATGLITPPTTPGGVNGATRAMSAYDVLRTTPVPQGGYDGFDLGKSSVYLSLYNVLAATKAGGVFFSIELQGS